MTPKKTMNGRLLAKMEQDMLRNLVEGSTDCDQFCYPRSTFIDYLQPISADWCGIFIRIGTVDNFQFLEVEFSNFLTCMSSMESFQLLKFAC